MGLLVCDSDQLCSLFHFVVCDSDSAGADRFDQSAAMLWPRLRRPQTLHLGLYYVPLHFSPIFVPVYKFFTDNLTEKGNLLDNDVENHKRPVNCSTLTIGLYVEEVQAIAFFNRSHQIWVMIIEMTFFVFSLHHCFGSLLRICLWRGNAKSCFDVLAFTYNPRSTLELTLLCEGYNEK